MITKRISALGSLTLALILLAIPASQAFASGECDDSKLPLAVRRAIEQDLPMWRVVTVGDLNQDDRGLWLQQHPTECPGFAVGNFDGRAAPSYAVTLLRQQGVKMLQTLVVVTKNKAGYRLRVLDKPGQTTQVGVVEKLPPGNYSSADESTSIQARFPVIQYEAIEAGAFVYYWKRGRYNSLVTSE